MLTLHQHVYNIHDLIINEQIQELNEYINIITTHCESFFIDTCMMYKKYNVLIWWLTLNDRNKKTFEKLKKYGYHCHHNVEDYLFCIEQKIKIVYVNRIFQLKDYNLFCILTDNNLIKYIKNDLDFIAKWHDQSFIDKLFQKYETMIKKHKNKLLYLSFVHVNLYLFKKLMNFKNNNFQEIIELYVTRHELLPIHYNDFFKYLDTYKKDELIKNIKEYENKNNIIINYNELLI